MQFLCEVLRPFEGPQCRQFKQGEIIDTSGFRLRRQLIEQKYLFPLYDQNEELGTLRAKVNVTQVPFSGPRPETKQQTPKRRRGRPRKTVKEEVADV